MKLKKLEELLERQRNLNKEINEVRKGMKSLQIHYAYDHLRTGEVCLRNAYNNLKK